LNKNLLFFFIFGLLLVIPLISSSWTYNPFTGKLDYYTENTTEGNTSQEIMDVINVTDNYFDIKVKYATTSDGDGSGYNESYEWFDNTTTLQQRVFQTRFLTVMGIVLTFLILMLPLIFLTRI